MMQGWKEPEFEGRGILKTQKRSKQTYRRLKISYFSTLYADQRRKIHETADANRIHYFGD